MRRYYPPTEDQQNPPQPVPNTQPANGQSTQFTPSVPNTFVPTTPFATPSTNSLVPLASTPNFSNSSQFGTTSTSSSAPPPTTPLTEPPVETTTDHHNPNLGLHGKKRVYFTNPEDQTSYEESYSGQSAQPSAVPTHPNQLAQGVQNMNLGTSAPATSNIAFQQSQAQNTANTSNTSSSNNTSGEPIPLSIGTHVQCPPLYMRMSLNAVPNSTNLLNKAGIPFGVIVHPLAQPLTKEDKIPVVNFGVSGIVRCRRCRSYINPFVAFIDGGRRWRCNLCGLTNDVPGDYYSPVDANGRRADLDYRPELNKGCVEFIAPSEYMVRPPQPPSYLFVIDVGYYSITHGVFQSVIEAIKSLLNEFPGAPRTRIGFITYDTSIHFYNLKSSLSQPQMLVVSDIDDIFLPLPDDMLVNLADSRVVIEALLNKYSTMFQSSQIVETVTGVALKAAYEITKNIGGKVMLFTTTLPTQGVGKLKNREDLKLLGTDKETSLLVADNNWYKEFALDCSRQQISVDVFFCPQQYVDVATLGAISQFTGGQVYFYPSFKLAVDSEKLIRDLSRNITRETGFEAVMRVRMSKGLKAQAHFGNFFIRSTDLLALPNVDADKAFGVQLALSESTLNTKFATFQSALLYTTSNGERRIRVFTQCLPITGQLVDLFKSADVDAVTTLTTKMAIEKAITGKLSDAREALVNKCLEILAIYRSDLVPQQNTSSLLLPETLKLFPLYILSLIKSILLRPATDIRPDERAYYLMHARTLSCGLTIPLLYPRMYAIHNLGSEIGTQGTNGAIVLPPLLNLNSEKLDKSGIFLVEDGQQMLIWVGRQVDPELLTQLFGVATLEGIDLSQATFPTVNTPLNSRVNAIINDIRRSRSTWMNVQLFREGDPREIKFFGLLVEDRSKSLHSYYEFLVNLHQRIQAKLQK